MATEAFFPILEKLDIEKGYLRAIFIYNQVLKE
jgi:hypothetical protein